MVKQTLFFFSILISTVAFSQSMVDTIHHIPGIDVKAKRTFKKEEAGMKKTSIDSLVLIEKISLSLSELLSENTPIFIKSHGRGALATASFRGTAASHTQVNWNGMNINSPMTGSVDFSLIPVYIVDEMNLLHGNASIAEKSGGLGGAINIKNEIDWGKNFGIKFMQGFGSYTTVDDYLGVQIGNKKIQSKTRVYLNYSKNDYTFLNRLKPDIDYKTGNFTFPLDTNKNADYRRYGLLQEFYFRPKENQVFSVKWWWQQAKRSIPTAISSESGNQSANNKNLSNSNKLIANWSNYLKNGKITARTGISFNNMDYISKRLISGKNAFTTVYSLSQEKSWLNNFAYQHNFSPSFSLETNLDVNYHYVSSEDTVKKEGYKKERYEALLMLGARKNFNNRLNINLMLREDWVDNSFSLPIPYLGFDYKPFKNEQLFLKGNLARNFHQPSLNDLYWQPGGNPNLKPEKGFSYELGVEYLRQMGNHSLETEITAYRSNIKDWIIWIPTFKGFWQPHNIKKVVSSGLEVNLKINGRFKQFQYSISSIYAYTKSLNYGDKKIWGDESYGKQLVYVPLHSGNFYGRLTYKNFFIAYQYTSYSERFTTSSNDLSNRKNLYPFFMNDVSLGKRWKIKNHHTLTANLKILNLFNETYHTILIRPMPKRNFMVELIYQI